MLSTLSIILSFVLIVATYAITESDRIKIWEERYGEWPPTEVLARENKAYTDMLSMREFEIMSQIRGSDERWENWMQHTQGRLVKNFTKMGFELVKTPTEVHTLLKDAVDKALLDFDNIPNEDVVDAIYHPKENVPKFVKIGALASQIHKMMLPYHEAWAGGIKLVPTSAYGVRLYRNQSSLVMHVDRVNTHVISSIVHITHEYDDDSRPWPLEIEGFDGALHSVSLQPGEMVFYESAKCFHGRLTEFRGKYYGSIFLHYMPVDASLWPYSEDVVLGAVPPSWSDGITHEYGARWAGPSVTVDSRIAVGAPPRLPNERQAALGEGEDEDEL
jgi:hypothetical protein